MCTQILIALLHIGCVQAISQRVSDWLWQGSFERYLDTELYTHSPTQTTLELAKVMRQRTKEDY